MNSKEQNAKVAPAALALVAGQLALALFVTVRFGLDPTSKTGPVLFLLVPLFALHALIPPAFRRPLVLAATAALLVYVLGVTAAIYVVGIGFFLIGLCHLPCSYLWRVLAVLSAAGALATIYIGPIDAGRYAVAALPILGGIFMFRLIFYLYDIRHEKPGTVSFLERINYFFLLPAPVFPFFPTLDYKVYLRCYYARPAFEIYQTGTLWISRGVTHLVLYRIIYHFFSPSAEFVSDLGGVMAFCLSGYLIYLKISGLFHIIGGVLRLFGYDLPETHRLYFFASGFSDYWRRINIYWKDFMAKIVFFPTFSALRPSGLGQAGRLAVATGVVFFVTIILHSYQGFWLRGSFVIHETDWYFWSLLGVLVIISNLIENRKGGALPKKNTWSLRAALVLSAKTVGMFVLLCVLWSLWSAQTLETWLDVMRQSTKAETWHVVVLLGFCGGAVILGSLGQFLAHRGLHLFVERPRPARSVATAVLPLLLLATLFEYHAARGLPGELGEKFEMISIDQKNARDQMGKERSYYEGLLAGVKSVGAEEEMRVKKQVDDIRENLYRANYGPRKAWGATWTTNRWNMRDKFYAKEKLAGVFRIAIGGASYIAGRGVSDDETFETLLENHLNEAAGNGKERVEILNFATADTCTAQRVADLRLRVADFSPDVFILFVHQFEIERNLRAIASIISEGRCDLTFPYLKKIAAEAGVSKGDPENKVIRALKPFAERIMRETYAEFAAICREKKITPVWIFVPVTSSLGEVPAAKLDGLPFAREADIPTIVLDRCYGDYPLEKFTLNAKDAHPNPLGHRLIARRLLEVLQERHADLGLPERITTAPPLAVE